MEQKFKVGDRVRHGEYGEGSVVHFDEDGWVGVSFDSRTIGHGCTGHCDYGTGWYYKESYLTLITPAQPTPESHPDRASYAFGFAKVMMANVPNFDPKEMGAIPAAAVKLADILIAELQKPKQ
jgi:hypothetical protein